MKYVEFPNHNEPKGEKREIITNHISGMHEITGYLLEKESITGGKFRAILKPDAQS